jgi:hypothetical protein
MKIRKFARCVVGTLAVALAASLSPVAPAHAQEKGPSDRSVRVLMHYAWTVLPHKFTTPQGKTIEVDKKKPNEVIVPLEVAREVIRVARLTAHAQMCELGEDQIANYRTLMRREEAKKKWSEQQMLYINQLHLFTVMWLTGKVKIVEKEGDKEVVIKETQAKAETCTDAQRAKVAETIREYVMRDAPKTTGSAAPTAGQASPAAAKK